MNILLVEDERKMAAFIKDALKEEHYAVDVVHSGQEALNKARVNSYNLIVLDIMLPGKDGFELCMEMRGSNINTPILFLSAKSGLRDKVKGFDLVADDYLTKPFEIEELLARVRALLRRDRDKKTPVLELADLRLDQTSREVERAGQRIDLTPREYALLRYMMLHANEVVTRTMITEHVWGEDSSAFTNVIDVYVNYIRNKVDKPFSPPLIQTIRSVGYMMKQPESS